jgi:ABC-2 type transport system permease protein
MKRLLEAELIKLRTTRTFAALAGVSVGLSILITVLVCVLTEPEQDAVLTDVFTADLSGIFILLLAAIGITGEWRHRTITSSLLAAPDRVRFLAAKTIAFAAAGVVLSLLIAAAIGVAGFTILSIRDLPTPGFGEWIAQVGRNALVAALFGGLGVALGALARNQAVTIVGVLVLIFVVDSAVTALVPSVGRYSPFSALPTGITDIPPDDAGLPEDIDLFSPVPATLLMLAWIGSLFAIGATLLKKRDVE